MKGQRSYTKEQEDLIIDLYVNQQKGQAYVCKIAHTTPATMKKFLVSRGYTIRNFSEAATISNINRAKGKNKDYFYTQSSNMAWLLGFLASDGCVRKDRNEIKIGLSKVDKEILEKIKQELQIENAISEYVTAEGFESVTLQWTCKEHKEELAKYSIIPEKTFKLKPPYALDKKYWIDYIRGYFDGDGSVNLIHNKEQLSLRWQVCSATPEILQFIVDYLYEEFHIPKVNIQTQKRPNHELYVIQYSTNATKSIYNILYTPNSLFLNRKKQHYQDILNEINSHETAIS